MEHLDPGLVMPFDKALDAAEDKEFRLPSAILQEAITVAKPYLAKPGDGAAEVHADHAGLRPVQARVETGRWQALCRRWCEGVLVRDGDTQGTWSRDPRPAPTLHHSLPVQV